MTIAIEHLAAAARAYSQCAKAAKAKFGSPVHPTAIESEQVIGFGIASDWNRRAASITTITYRRRIQGRTIIRSRKRNLGVTELLRFNLAWYAMNAVFSRTSILHLLGTPVSTSELNRFRLVFSHAGLSSTKLTALVTTLHTILNATHITRMPGLAAETPVSALEAIFYKYTPADFQAMPNGKIIKTAIATKNLAPLDLPLLIYLMRNWTIHGSMMDGAFGSMVRFRTYIDTILVALAQVHAGASGALLSKL